MQKTFGICKSVASQRRKKYNLRFHRTKPCDKFISLDYYKCDSHYYARYNSKRVNASSVSSKDVKEYSKLELESFQRYCAQKTQYVTQNLIAKQIQQLEQSTINSSMQDRLDKFIKEQADAIKRKAKLPSAKLLFPSWVSYEKIEVLKSNRIYCRKDYHKWMLLHHPDKCKNVDLSLVQKVTDAVAACKWK